MRAGQGHSRKFPHKKPSQFSQKISQESQSGTQRKITHLGTNTTPKGCAQVTPKDTRSSLEGCTSRKLKCRRRFHLSLPQGNTGPGHKHSHQDTNPKPQSNVGAQGGCDGAELSLWSLSFLRLSSGVTGQRTQAGSLCCTQGRVQQESWNG